MVKGKRSTIEFRKEILKEHEMGKGSFRELSEKHKIDIRQIKRWSAWNKEFGIPQRPKKTKTLKEKKIKSAEDRIKLLELEIELLKKVQEELRG